MTTRPNYVAGTDTDLSQLLVWVEEQAKVDYRLIGPIQIMVDPGGGDWVFCATMKIRGLT